MNICPLTLTNGQNYEMSYKYFQLYDIFFVFGCIYIKMEVMKNKEFRLADVNRVDRIIGLSTNVEICQEKIKQLEKSLQEWHEIKQGFETEIRNIGLDPY